MRFSLVLLAIIGLTAGNVLNKGNHNDNNNNNYDDKNNGQQADQKFLEKQQVVLQLLSYMQQGNQYHKLAQIGNNFHPEQNFNKFNNPQAVKSFFKNYYNNNFLPMDEVFCSTNQQHQNQAGQLFNFFYSAQDWETFEQAAAWARDRFNPDMFVFAFSAAVLNHPKTQGVILPALYEVMPHAFVPATALQKIYYANFEGRQHFNVYANYTNQNERNNKYNYYYYNKYQSKSSNNNNNDNDYQNNDYNNPHNSNSAYADDDGSIINNAGTPENPENRVTYFTEDPAINEFHARYHAMYPPFFGSNNNYNFDEENYKKNNNNANYYSMQNIRRGLKFYYNHQQLFARYVLERISNDLPIPRPINFDQEIKTGYNPNLQYANGQSFPARPPFTQFYQQSQYNDDNFAQQPNNNQDNFPQTYQHRLHQAAAEGYVKNEDGSKTEIKGSQGVGILANLVAAPANNPNTDYYGDYFSTGAYAIGNIVDPNNQNNVAPGAVANYATAARDPAYYQFLANMMQVFYNYQNNLGPYKQSQLNFQGVKIQQFDVSQLVTYFDTHTVNVNNAFAQNKNNNNNNNNNNNSEYYNQNDNMNYNVKFQRLTNKPYSYKLVVHSDKSTNAVVRVFIGPKFDSNGQAFTLPQASQYFVQLDKFRVQLQNGQNVFQRNSNQSPNFVQESPSFRSLWNRLQLARQSQQPFFFKNANQHGFPQSSQLPKGKQSGQEFVFYAIINDVDSNNDNNSDYMNNDNQNSNQNNMYNDRYDQNNLDGRSIGYPFDRPIKDSNYNSSNQYFKTVTIYHKFDNNNSNSNNNNNKDN